MEQKYIKCNLNKFMAEQRLKVADVAQEIGVHWKSISLLYYDKAKRIDCELLYKVCKYFNCSVGDMLEITEETLIES